MADEEETKLMSPVEEVMDIDEDSAEDGEEEEDEDDEEEDEEEDLLKEFSLPLTSTPQDTMVFSLSGKTHGPKGLSQQAYLSINCNTFVNVMILESPEQDFFFFLSCEPNNKQ